MRPVLFACLLCASCSGGIAPETQSSVVGVTPLLVDQFEEGSGGAIANTGDDDDDDENDNDDDRGSGHGNGNGHGNGYGNGHEGHGNGHADHGNGHGYGHCRGKGHGHDGDGDSNATTTTVLVSDVSTLSGAEALATDVSCGLFVKSLQDPAGAPVQLAHVHDGVTTVLGTHSSIRNSDVSGIAMDPMTGRLLIADEAGGRIALVDPATQSLSTAFDLPWALNPGSNGTGQLQFAPNVDGTILYFWDSTRSAVFRLDRLSGALTTVLAVDQETPAGQHQTTYINDIVFDAQTGTILLSDNLSDSVLEIDPSTSPPTVMTLFAGISGPTAIALSPTGTEIYVASAFHSILVGPRSGGSLSTLAEGFPFVTDLVACGDSVFAVDKSLDTIFRIHPSDLEDVPCEDDDDDDDDGDD